ncbi:HET-domain-containing protein [Mytilinidion resinicola]|uniref:HET-domain-containing protein n=1 Tax=Mytilinidion resinicola TaxID=574789 RepID=A0A6A6Y766_9PEZI|nr:HET-domain-containing protein [Mytilinidion resinicola]KAF2804373.1 HET-domain-containing protein [Mytilinidion resinicola]
MALIRLLQRKPDGEIVFREPTSGDVPAYAILTHTWGKEEVNFEDMEANADMSKTVSKAGWRKIQFCANQAAADGLRYFWIDTCCIDKKNAVELGAAINSMFRWYQNAARCYAYLSDGERTLEQAFRTSPWFTRGWTLQELIAPRLVDCFSSEGERLGSRLLLKPEIHKITGIAKNALRAASKHDKDPRLAVDDDEEQIEDDFGSILSNTADIQSNVSVDTSLPTREGKLHLAQMLATHPDLAPLCRKALARMDRDRFINTARKLLKPYYRNLLEEVSTERQRASVQLLKSRRGRHQIAAGMAKLLDVDVDNENSEKRDEVLEQVQRRAEYLNTRISQVPHVVPNEPFSGTGRLSDVVSHGLEDEVNFDDGLLDEDQYCPSTGSDVPDFSNLAEMEGFFRESKPFGLLLSEFRKLLLPQQLRHVINTIPRTQIWLSPQQDRTLLNRAKAHIEDYTQLEWDWWPLKPRMRDLSSDETRVIWKCVCGQHLWLEISNEDAELIRDILPIMDNNPPWSHRCRPKVDRPTWGSRVPGFIYTAAPTSSASQRYTPSSNAGLSSSSTPATGAISSTSNAGRSSTSSPNMSQQLGGTTSSQQPIATSITSNATNQLWVLFGVQGPRRPLEMDHILVDGATNDDTFYRSLRKTYQFHRGKLRLWFSFWRFRYCEVVKFKRLAPRWVIRDRKDLPSGVDYEYDPRPPRATNPPISRHEFAMHLNACDQPCPWSWSYFHECMPQLNTLTSITSIPKKRKQFNTTTTSSTFTPPADAFAWGLEARHSISALYVVIYHVLIVAGPFAFWAWWMTRHPGDMQNASIPTTIVLGLLSLFWCTNGILTQGRETKEL